MYEKSKWCVFGTYINATEKTLEKGDFYTLKLKGTEIKSVKTSNKKVATVNKKGKVVAKKEGTATITLNGKNGKSYNCQVTVKEPENDTEEPANGSNKYPISDPVWTGGNITLKNIGVTIPTLGKFNKAGLNTDGSATWFGNGSSYIGNFNILNDTAVAIEEATGYGVDGSDANGFTVANEHIDWAYASYGAVNSLTLRRDTANKYYILEINTPLDKNIYGIHDVAPISRDIVKFMISAFSSTPETVYNKIYRDLYKDICISQKGWTTVGDCKIQCDYDSCYKGHYVYKFKAK